MSDIDDKVASAWRSASREEPPAAVDAVLRAAARRAVGAGPERSRHMQTWPLAAAAVVAVLAIGILQLTPPEMVTVTPVIVADSAMQRASTEAASTAAPAAATSKAGTGAPAAATSSPSPPAETAVSTPAPADKSQTTGQPARIRDQADVRDQANVPRQVAQVPPPASPGRPSDGFTGKPDVASATGSAKSRARADAGQSAESKLSAERDAREVAAAPAPRAEPFPAAGGAPPAESSAGREDAGTLAAAPQSPSAPPAALAANQLAKPQAAAINAMRAEESQAPAPPSATTRIAAARERMKDAAIKPPDEWIKLIRRMKSEGRNDEAAKELAAFRTAYGDRADALLPADLRAPRP